MESILIDIKNPGEKKVLTAFLKRLKINFENISQVKEDLAMRNAITKGKQSGRATKNEQKKFEAWLKSL